MALIGCVPSGTIDGANKVFTLSTSGAAGLSLYLNGKFETPGLDFFLGPDGRTITYTTPPSIGDTHYAQVFF